jgi:hypothetical protein
MQELQEFAQGEVANGPLGGLDRIYNEAIERGLFDGISPTAGDKQWKYNMLRTIITKTNPKYIRAHKGSLLGPCSGASDHCIRDC